MEENNSPESKGIKEFTGLSGQDFLIFGLDQIAYIKPVTINGSKVWAIHAANGKPLSVVDSAEKAVISSLQNDLKPVRLH